MIEKSIEIITENLFLQTERVINANIYGQLKTKIEQKTRGLGNVRVIFQPHSSAFEFIVYKIDNM